MAVDRSPNGTSTVTLARGHGVAMRSSSTASDAVSLGIGWLNRPSRPVVFERETAGRGLAEQANGADPSAGDCPVGTGLAERQRRMIVMRSSVFDRWSELWVRPE